MLKRCLSLMCGLAFVVGLVGLVRAGEARFYWDSNHRGKVLYVPEGTEYESLSRIGWNDKISSYQIDDDVECVVTKNSKFGGDYLYLKPGESRAHMPNGWNDKISSIKCAEEGYFDKNDDGYDTESAAYEHAHFAGVKLMLSGRTYEPNLKSIGFNDFISSVRISRDANFSCTFYRDADFKHELFTLQPGQGYNRLSTIGADNKISSIKCYYGK